MIAVRIPEEIKKYKEKIAFGLNARQIISSIITLGVCVPLYFYGKKFIAEDILSWLIIIIAVPLLAIGFFKYNGMPAEKVCVAVFKYGILFPMKRKYKTINAFRDWQNVAIREEVPTSFYDKTKLDAYNQSASLERAALIKEAEELGEEINPGNIELITVKKPKLTSGNSGGSNNQDNKLPKDKKREKRRKEIEALKEEAQLIEEKIRLDPHYLPTRKEQAIRKRYSENVLKERKDEVLEKKKDITKKNSEMKRRRTAKTSIPKSTQDSIPYIADYDEGMFEVAPNKFSKVYRIKDINYRTAKEEEQIQIFCKLGEFLNYFSEDINFAFCIDNKIVSIEEQERQVFYQMAGDDFDRHREEYNRIIRKQLMVGRNDIQLYKFVTVTIDAPTPIEALMKFHKLDNEIILNLRKIGSDGVVLTTEERLSYYYDIYRKGNEGELNIDFDFIKSQGISSKDYIAPTSMVFNNKYFTIEDTYYRVMHLCNLPASLSDELMFELYSNDFPVTISMNIQPVAQDKGLKIVKRQLTGIEKDKIDAEKRAIKGGYSPDTIQHSIKDAHAQAEMLYDDMLNKNQKMFFVTFTCMVQGETLDELNENCKIMESKARKFTAEFMTLTYQQEEGYKITLPFGYLPKDICVERTLTTESTAIFMPFSNQELFQKGGYYYGLNQISHNLVVVNRLHMKTPSGFVLGTSGSGKSFATKREILNVLLHDSETGILIIDPENEYGDFARAFGGAVLNISADSDLHINPMDMTEDYGLDESDDENVSLSIKKDKAIRKKSDYIMSIVERMISSSTSAVDKTEITPVQKTLVDRCVSRCYKEFLDHDFDSDYLPTLIDLQNELDKEKGSPEGRMVAEAVEYYTRGSMNVFAHKTNVDVSNRLVVFNVRDLGEQLRQIALIIVFDFIWNRMIENKTRGVRTNCYCDEIHVMFQSYYSANFLKQLYKRGRKYGLCITGLTQNVEDLLRSEQARGMIGNSDFILMLNQNSEDLALLASMLNLSEQEMNYVFGSDPGSGLLFAEKVVVPFVDQFPTDSYLYKLMSTKFGEDMTRREIDAKIHDLIDEKHEEE